MFHQIEEIIELDNLKITVRFSNGVIKIYNVEQLIPSFPQMKPLKNNKLFKTAVLDSGGYGISWNDNIDIAAEEIWNYGIIKK